MAAGIHLPPPLIFIRQIKEATSLIITPQTLPYVSPLLDTQQKMVYFLI